MTAEIAVLNSHGIAMAADSAVSIGNSKVYNSANKLFALSKSQPVGVMVYGNATTMGVPWETLVKTYRQQELKGKKFKTLNEYGEDFIRYLTKTTNIANNNEDVYVHNIVSSLIKKLLELVEKGLKTEFEKNPELTSEQILTIISNLINMHCNQSLVKERLEGIDNKWVKNLRSKIRPWVKDSIKNNFENIPISEADSKIILETCACIFYGKRYDDNHTGIVIAGFGDDEVYPCLVSYEIEWRVMGYLKHKLSRKDEININNTAAIVPFAQREMVDTFMLGSDPRLVENIHKRVDQILRNAPNTIFEGTSTRIAKKTLVKIQENCDKIMNEFITSTANLQRINFIQPVLDSVGVLPLDELATMAQTLINITSFKRRVSLNTESVGGPIDVAVISKGDGFIWINRKHYFKPEYNQHYFVNSSRKDD